MAKRTKHSDTNRHGRLEKTVFISYRRSSVPWALAIYQNLTHNGYDVFFDYEGIGSGDFEQVILDNIKARAHFLVLLTPSALEKIQEPGDWLCREIEAALETRRNIVPLMLEGFDFATPAVSDRLTGSLTPLKRYNGVPIVASYFEEAMERLRSKHLNISLDAVVHPPSPIAAKAARSQQAAAASAPPVQERTLTAEQWFERAKEATDPQEKIRLFTETLRLRPDHGRAYVGRAEARFSAGDRDGAMADYDEALRINAANEFVYWSRATVRSHAGDFNGALADSNEAIRLSPRDPFNYSTRGRIREQIGDGPGAIADFTEAIRLKPELVTAYYSRGLLRRERGDLEGAIADFSDAIARDRTRPAHFSARAKARAAQHDLKNALEDYNESIRLNPHNQYYRIGRAALLEQLGDRAGAIADYKACIEVGGGKETPPAAKAMVRLQMLRET